MIQTAIAGWGIYAPEHARTNAEPRTRRLGGLEGPSRRLVGRKVAEEARTRGFAAPAFAGCALITL